MSELKTNNIARHGDLNFRSVDKPKGLKKINKDNQFVLAEGEHTGHKHLAVADKEATLNIYEKEGKMYMEVLDGDVKLSHQEHKTIVFQPGFYEVGHEEEYDPFAKQIQKVVD